MLLAQNVCEYRSRKRRGKFGVNFRQKNVRRHDCRSARGNRCGEGKQVPLDPAARRFRETPANFCADPRSIAVAGKMFRATQYGSAGKSVKECSAHATHQRRISAKAPHLVTGLEGLICRSSIGAKFKLHPTAESSRPIARATSRTASASPSAPICAGEGHCVNGAGKENCVPPS